jgi:sporulation protein YlmC with PRC-barrel domain
VNHRLATPILIGFAVSLVTAQDAPRAPHAEEATVASMRSAPRFKASQLIGCAITNTKNESLGEIQDIVLDHGNQRIAYAVVSFGGFLGMGEKYFAMPWRLIAIDQRSSGDTPRVTLGLDPKTLEATSGFDKHKWPDMGNAAWVKQVDDYFAAHKEVAREGGATDPKGSAADGTSGVDRPPTSNQFVHRRLGRLIGMSVVDAKQSHLAEVEDLVVDPRTAAIDGMLLSFGGTLGFGEKIVLVPADALTLDREKDVFVFPCSKADMEAMVLVGNKWPALSDSQWLTNGRELCAKAKTAHMTMNGDTIPVDASGKGSVPFADIYDATKVETVKGVVSTIGSVQIGDRKEEHVRLRIRTQDDRDVIVYGAPASFEDQQMLGLRKGQKVEVTGSPAKYGTQTVLVAGKIVVDGKTATLRDEKGIPAWRKQ